MSNDRFDVLERYAPMFDAPEPGFEKFLRRRDRKRRNQRIAAALVGIALFVLPVTLIAVLGSRDRAETPAGRNIGGVPKVDYVLDLNTGSMTPLPEPIVRSLGGSVLSGSYAVSPDGSTLAYAGLGDDGNPQIFIAGIDGTGVRQVTYEPTGATRPAWSPDGSRIVYQDNGNHPSLLGHLVVLEVATDVSTPLGPKGSDPQFTPDGSSVLYTTTAARDPNAIQYVGVVRTVPVAGGRSTLLMKDAWNASLAPDGSLVTFMSTRADLPPTPSGRLVAEVGSTIRRSLPGAESNPSGTWSLDGSRIVCREVDGSDVIVLDVATGDATRVADGRSASWLDDHRLLIEV